MNFHRILEEKRAIRPKMALNQTAEISYYFQYQDEKECLKFRTNENKEMSPKQEQLTVNDLDQVASLAS